jgi:hypothetical protein
MESVLQQLSPVIDPWFALENSGIIGDGDD